MFLVKEREMIANNIFREFFIGVLFDKKNILGDLRVFDMSYSDLIGIKNSIIKETKGNYDLSENEIYISADLIKENNNVGIIISYLYQKRMQIQDYCIKNNISKIDSLMYDYEVIKLKKDKTPITGKGYYDFDDSFNLDYLNPWTIDAYCYAYSTLSKLIDRYVFYCRDNKLEIRSSVTNLERIKYNLIEKYNIAKSQKLDSRIQKNITLFKDRMDKEFEIVKKIKDNLFDGSIDVETLIIGEKIIDYLDEVEIASMNAGYNEIAKKRYINSINMQDKSLEEICEYIINKNNNIKR